MNPLFSDDQAGTGDDPGYVLPHGDKRHIQPPHRAAEDDDNPAVAMIRRKIDAMYAHEPSAKQEVAEARAVHPPRSKHQDFMYRLTTSGHSMASIQTAWHNYYSNLPDNEKHEVWQEFYSANAKHATRRQPTATPPTVPAEPEPAKPVVVHHVAPETEHRQADQRSVAAIKKQLLGRVRASHSAQLKAKQHFQSLLFGLSTGAIVVLIFLFGLFNELVIAPFIRPGSASATPIILSSDAPAPSATPEVIIPKINAELPVVYGGQSLAEADVQKALEDGVYHYPTTAVPGQNGNAAFFGHSSNNIFNKGRYKFAFVLLRELEPGDIFYLTYNSKVYTYKVYSKKIVSPDETWVLNPVQDKPAVATLITCDPPGTTLHRLVVWGEQISPDPGINGQTAQPSAALQTQNLLDNGPSAWSRFVDLLNPFN